MNKGSKKGGYSYKDSYPKDSSGASLAKPKGPKSSGKSGNAGGYSS